MADFGAGMTSADGHELQRIIEECDIPTRLQLSLELLKKEHAIVSLQRKLGQEVEEKVNKMQRKFMLNEQLKIIKKELGIEKDDKQALVDKFNDRIKDKTLPSNIAEVFLVCIEKFKCGSLRLNYISLTTKRKLDE